ncbi:protein OS-9-like [Penaeus chinensis]|uniref:protein OS-9-like n=1 Tax=Penaeus chinensis TaxID=139456 RepID=UPI001FB78ACF|nr:protein OS-9-like [Penaeus chinensis]
MIFHILVVVGTLLATGNTLNTVLNVEEITSIHYAVDIIEQPVSREQHLEGEVISVVNKHGQEFVCSLPSVTPTDADSKSDENILDQLVDISGLLKPMETAPCLIKTVDWWTYEFCYGSVIKQYHLEDNKASGPILILGKYESEYNWKNSSETKNRLQRFHSQFYVNGTKCDLTGEPRRTEVRFHCEDGVGDYIQRVDEPESCRYVVTVATTRVCHHPYLRLQAVRTPHAITCAPVISEEQYLRYVDYQERKTKEEESLKEKWLKQNEELTHESEMGESQSMLEPVSSDSADDDELKMSIKIFRLYPVKKQKNAQAAEAKEDVMGVETQITLEENDLEMKVEDINLSTETEASGKGPISSEYGTDIDKNTDIPESTGEAETKDFFSGEDKLHIIQYSDSDVENPTERVDEDEDDVDDEDDIDDDIDRKEKVLTQASKSTNRDHFSKLLRRLKQLGNMFMNQEGEENAKPGNQDRISELQHVVDSIKDGHIKQFEQEVKEWTKNLLNKDTLPDMDEDDLEEEEQRLGTSLSSLMDALDKAENKLSIAKKEMETLEEFLDSQLKEMEHTATHNKESEEAGTQDKLEWEYQDPTEGMSQTPENLQSDVEDPTKSKSIMKNADKKLGGTRQLNILKNKVDDESQKSKLEQTIKDRLQKLGLERLGRKVEVKILTPNSLEEEDSNNLLLSQEETEAFQNMIVNLLSANAEELEEREHHRKLEKNYGFKFNDNKEAEEDE